MLIDFQRALADLTASPELTRQVRRDPQVLRELYSLEEREFRQIAAVASSPGMTANCMLYRANRLAPIALNLPRTCEHLHDRLAELLSDYWHAEPITNVHFLLETERFCRFLQSQVLPDAARISLEAEASLVAAKIAYSKSAGGSG